MTPVNLAGGTLLGTKMPSLLILNSVGWFVLGTTG